MGRGPGVRAVGKQSLQIDFRWKGVRYRERLRLEPTKANLRYAANLKARIEHDIAKGTFDLQAYFPHRGSGGELVSDGRGKSLRCYLQRFIEDRSERIQPETAREYRDAVEILTRQFGDKPLESLTVAEVEDWLASLKLSTSRQNNLLIPLRGAIKRAIRRGEISKNPIAGLEIHHAGGKVEIDPFSREEVEALSRVYCGPMWKFWAWTGMRSGELAGLEWGDVDGCRRSASIRRAMRLGREKSTKTEAGTRVVRLLRPARESLGEPREGRVWANPATGNGFTHDKQLRVAFQKACKEAGVRYRYPYQLRHTFASWAMAAGEPVMWIAAQMGHKDPTMVLKTYARFAPELYPDAGGRMEK